MKISKIFSVISMVALLISSTSCVETVVVGSIATGAVATREKSLNNTRYDIGIYTTLNIDFVQNGLKSFGNSIDVTVNEGRVLLTGIARDAMKAKLASDLAWKASGVREVIDEIQIREDESIHFKDFSKASYDYFLSSKIETRLLFTKKIPTFNYKITTVSSSVYVIGVAADEAELSRVLSVITKIRGVEKVISHVIFTNDRRRNG